MRLTLVYVCLAVQALQIDGIKAKFVTLTEALKHSEQLAQVQVEQWNLPSLAIGLSVKGKLVWHRVWGYADLENGVAATLRTKYRLASISKTFTSALFASLVERGLVQYDDPLSRYVSEIDFPVKQWKGKSVNLTMRQLLSHTSGTMLSNETDFNSLIVAQNATQLMHKFKERPLLFEPGTSWMYSNYGFQLIGVVIERVTGKPFPEVMSHFVHNTLGLKATFVETDSLLVKNRARHYRFPDPKTPRPNIPTGLVDDLFVTEGYWPSGELISTVDDLLEYGKLLIDSYKARNGSVLHSKTIKQMWTSQTSQQGNLPQYGLGWFLSTATNDTALGHSVWHSGGLWGVSTHLVIHPEEEIVGVVLTNKGFVEGLQGILANTLHSVYEFVQ